ncbi:MAG: TetR/AcrR family transcriptional regulator [Armatimonadetes bacterium]|nr:TetR/AcrR family transcriptional regulator [Armatimonadota bacterium]
MARGSATGSTEGAALRRPIESVTRERLLQAAMDVFAQHGYHGTTVDDIVAASQTSKGAFYHYFPSKQGIFLNLLDRLIEMVEAGVEGAIEHEEGGLAKVEAALRVVLEVASAHQDLARILLIEAAALGPEFEQSRLGIHRRFAALIQRHLDRAVADGSIPAQDSRAAAMAWIGAINEVVTQDMAAGRDLMASLPAIRTLLLRSVGARVADETA